MSTLLGLTCSFVHRSSTSGMKIATTAVLLRKPDSRPTAASSSPTPSQ